MYLFCALTITGWAVAVSKCLLCIEMPGGNCNIVKNYSAASLSNIEQAAVFIDG